MKEFTTPTNGRRICSSLYPSAFKRERCGACSTPAFTLSEFMIFLLMKLKARRGCLALKNFFRVSLPRSATLADLRPLVRGHSPYESAGKDSLMCEHNVNFSSSDSLPRSATLTDLRPFVRGHSPYKAVGKDSLMCKHNVNLSPPPLHCSFSYATI